MPMGDEEEAKLTAMGQAMSLASKHKGNRAVHLADMPEESFVSERADGKLVVTLANTDMENSLEWKLPEGYAVVDDESSIWQAESFLPRSTFARKPLAIAGSVDLPPFSMALVVLAKIDK